MFILTYVYQKCVKIYGNCNEEVGGRSFSILSTSPLCHLNSSLKRQRYIFWTIYWCFLLHCALHPRREGLNWSHISTMATTVKGIYKGFKYTISQFFVVKEREIEIGYPTDVKHVAHIGWDGPSGSAPSWMNEFKTGPDFAATSIGNTGSALSPWSSQDFGDQSMRQKSGSELFKDTPPSEVPPVKRKQKRKKCKPTSSPKSNSGSTSRSSRAAAKSKAKFIEGNANPNPTNIEVE